MEQMKTGAAAILARIGVVGLNQLDQRLPRQHRLRLREELLPFGLLLGGGELVIKEAELLTAHVPSPGLRSQIHCHAEGLGFFRVSLGEMHDVMGKAV
jgi:hypothetical protein